MRIEKSPLWVNGWEGGWLFSVRMSGEDLAGLNRAEQAILFSPSETPGSALLTVLASYVARKERARLVERMEELVCEHDLPPFLCPKCRYTPVELTEEDEEHASLPTT